MKPQPTPEKKRTAKRTAPRQATAAPHCARLEKCPAGSCHYPQPCNHQTLQPTFTA